MSGLYSLVAGAQAQEIGLEILAHNLANVNTTAFKEERPIFDVFVVEAESSGEFLGETEFPVWENQNTVIQFSDIRVDFSQGPLVKSSNSLDLALQGEGFFVIDTPDGKQYARAGNFKLDAEGQLVTQAGYAVLGVKGDINLKGSDVAINRNGKISLDGTEIDQLRIVTFAENTKVTKSSLGFYVPDDPSADEDATDVTVFQGFIERSNVSPMKGIVRLIEYQRAYEAYQNTIKTIIGEGGITANANDVGTVQ